MNGATMKQELTLIQNPSISDMVWTSGAKRLALLILHSFRYNEPVLLVGETGLGKTKVCQSIADLLQRNLMSVNCHLNTESSDFLGGLRPTRDTNDKPFEWVDGPLVKAMESGAVFLIDEISLAEDGVLERLNSVLESERNLFLMEQNIGDGDDLQGVRCIAGHENFQIVATMNPGGDFGKRELSPALRNRLVEIWCPSMANKKDLTDLMESRIGPELTNVIKDCILNFIEWYDCQQVSRKVPFTTRDLVAWMTFIKDTNNFLNIWCSVIHGLCLVITDGLANTLTGESLNTFLQETRNLLKKNVPETDENTDSLNWILSQGSCHVVNTEAVFQIGAFGVPKSLNCQNPNFHFESETVARNAMKLLRGLQVIFPCQYPYFRYLVITNFRASIQFDVIFIQFVYLSRFLFTLT